MGQEKALQQVAGDAGPVLRGGAPVAQGAEIGVKRVSGCGEGRRAPRLAAQGSFRFIRTLGRSGHSAEGEAAVGNDAVFNRDTETRCDRGNVLVAPLGDLVGGIALPGNRSRHADAFNELLPCAVLFAVFDKEGLQRQGALCRTLAQCDGGAERDQDRRGIADGRAVGDIAADRAHVAHLLTCDAVPVGVQMRETLRMASWASE